MAEPMEVKEIACRTIVNPTGGFLAAFTHTLNPYHGCSLGRTLCGLPDYAPAIIGAWGERRAWGHYLDVNLARRFPLSVQITVETDRESLGDLFPRHAYPVRERLAALGALKERGIECVGVVAPMWPIEDAEGFARRLNDACAFVVVDHYLLGDGTPGGTRTRGKLLACGRTFPDLLTAGGFEAWTRLKPFEKVVEIFRRVLGEERVGVSKEGFHRASHRLLKGATMAARNPETR